MAEQDECILDFLEKWKQMIDSQKAEKDTTPKIDIQTVLEIVGFTDIKFNEDGSFDGTYKNSRYIGIKLEHMKDLLENFNNLEFNLHFDYFKKEAL